MVGKHKFCKSYFIMLSTYRWYLFTKIKSTELFNNMSRLVWWMVKFALHEPSKEWQRAYHFFFQTKKGSQYVRSQKKMPVTTENQSQDLWLHDQCYTAWAIENKRDSTQKTNATHALATTATD